MQLDASQVDFMVGLGKSPVGQQLKLVLEAEVARTNGELRKQSGENLIRLQGRAVMLDELIAAFSPRAIPRHMRQVTGFIPETRGIDA